MNEILFFYSKSIIVYILLSVLYTIIINQLYSISTIFFSFHLVKSIKNPSCYVVMLCYVCYVFNFQTAIHFTCDRQFLHTPLWINCRVIGDSFPIHWESTLSPLGIHWSCDPMKMRMNNYAENVKIIRILFAYMRNVVYICIEIQ